jgi:hypothetical protein
VAVEVRPAPDAEPELIFTNAEGGFQWVGPGPVWVGVPGAIPPALRVDAPRDDLLFRLPPACGLDVVVVSEGEAVPGARVELRVRLAAGDPWSHTGRTGDDGVLAVPQAPCGVGRIDARAQGSAEVRVEPVDLVVERRVRVDLVRGVGISGLVLDPEGAPVAGARVRAPGASDHSDADGAYALRVDPRRLSAVEAQADGYLPASERLRVGADATAVELDLVLEPARTVVACCLGLPGDSCAGVEPLVCTHPLWPLGAPCATRPAGEPGEVTCACPDGDAALRGAGQAVAVAPGAQEACLDLRGGGAMRGRVLRGGRPVACVAQLARVPVALEDVPGGMAAGARARCDDEGRFSASGLKPGSWAPVLLVDGETRVIEAREVRAGVEVDLGDIELGDGGTLTGVVVDGRTGEGRPGVAVVAVDESRVPPWAGTGTSGPEGRFALRGVPDGELEVFLVTRPFNTVKVRVDGGEGPDDLELRTGEAPLLEANGVGLETDSAGELVVSTVDPDGAAARAGLEPGDRVIGVVIGGVKLREVAPGWSDAALDQVLNHWDGPGLALEVDRGGEVWELELE